MLAGSGGCQAVLPQIHRDGTRWPHLQILHAFYVGPWSCQAMVCILQHIYLPNPTPTPSHVPGCRAALTALN
jgi:hypothetical protein